MAIQSEMFDLNARAKAIQYRIRDYMADFLERYAHVIGSNLKGKIDVSWERSEQHMCYVMCVRITINPNQVWQYRHMVDEELFELSRDKHRIEYFEYLVNLCSRTCQTGIVCAWLDDRMGELDDERVQEVWRQKVQPQISQATITQGGDGRTVQSFDLINIALKDLAYPVTATVKEIINEPKLLCARLLMVIK